MKNVLQSEFSYCAWRRQNVVLEKNEHKKRHHNENILILLETCFKSYHRGEGSEMNSLFKVTHQFRTRKR